MRFQFCGNLSCPQWFIAEISVLTKITAVKMRLIFGQLIVYYLQSADISSKTLKLLTGTGLDHYEMNAVVSTLYFILNNSVMFQVSDTILNKQLVDLGLPKENVESITKIYKTNRDKLIEVSLQRGIHSNKDTKISFKRPINRIFHSLTNGKFLTQQQARLPFRIMLTNLPQRARGEIEIKHNNMRIAIRRPNLPTILGAINNEASIIEVIELIVHDNESRIKSVIPNPLSYSHTQLSYF